MSVVSSTQELEMEPQQPAASVNPASHLASDELNDESEGWLASVFGVLFIMSKETELPILLMYAGVAIDFVQVSSRFDRYCILQPIFLSNKSVPDHWIRSPADRGVRLVRACRCVASASGQPSGSVTAR